MSRNRTGTVPVGLAGILLLLRLAFADRISGATDSPGGTEIDSSFTGLQLADDEKVVEGERLARLHCVSCHLFPEPELLDKKTWVSQTLRRMKIRLGLSPAEFERQREYKLLKATGAFPETPIMSLEEFNTIAAYYAAKAPTNALPQEPHPEIQVGLKHFQRERAKYRRAPPTTTLVQISRSGRYIYMGDDYAKSLDILGADGRFLGSVKVDNIPVALAETEKGIYLTCIGNFFPSEDPKGELIFLERAEKGFKPGKVILRDLPRPTYTEFADLNEDGKTDFVLSMFGNVLGGLSWFENKGEGQYQEHVVIAKAGAIRTVVQDFNGDKHLDIAVLITQELECFYILLNDGHGDFSGNVIFQRPPLYGHTYFEMADFNRDGLPDILVTNGDNGEYPSPLKKYHGIRIYLNKGNWKFEEAFFYPLNGAFKAVARDFDEDGDLDIAAISYFPDYADNPKESFVYLENLGGLHFAASTFGDCISGRWLIMDVGDLDGDGDWDIVLGSYIRGPTDVPAFLSETWEKYGPSVKILTNTTR